MEDIRLEIADVSNLELKSCKYNLRKDLISFVDFCSETELKRTHRNNDISKTDVRKIAKLFGYKDIIGETSKSGKSDYIEFIDHLAYKLEFTVYETAGVYMGYTSSEKSYPENYVEINHNILEKYINGSLYNQEKAILELLINDYGNGHNEFYKTHFCSSLEAYIGWNNGGITNYIDFAKPRNFLLDLLFSLPVGEWFTTQSLIQYLKQNHFFFLIPKTLKWQRNNNQGRYSGLELVKRGYNYYPRDEIKINESDPDAFEKGEGGWIERFLEYIPLIMGFVDVAYDNNLPLAEYVPTFGKLKAFKVNHRLKNYFKDDYNIKATLQPNFELIVEAPIYPVKIARTFLPLCDTLTENPQLVMRLNKIKVLKYVANNKADIIEMLTESLTHPIPDNVLAELKEWIGQTDRFILYSGFALYENNGLKDEVEVVHKINEKNALIKNGAQVYESLLIDGKVPLIVNHKDNKFTSVPKVAKTAFGKATQTKNKAQAKEKVSVFTDTFIEYKIDNKNFYKALLLKCSENKIVKTYNDVNCSIVFNKKVEKIVNEIIKELKSSYTVSIKS